VAAGTEREDASSVVQQGDEHPAWRHYLPGIELPALVLLELLCYGQDFLWIYYSIHILIGAKRSWDLVLFF
jgi:hypothetical protein